jgi:Lon protease-like protein
MRRLPLFPLPIVLFPGGVTPLHIFEPRYRQMVARCLEFDRQFGLIYHDPDRFGPFERTPGRVGTVAEIGEFRILPDGRSLLLALGKERFRIVDGIESETPYHEALIETFHDPPGSPPGSAGEERLMERRQDTLTLLATVIERQGSPGVLSESVLDPADEVSFRVASVIRTDPMWQQGLLSLETEVDRLDRIDDLLRGALVEEGPDEFEHQPPGTP